jgi:hypothetical protein
MKNVPQELNAAAGARRNVCFILPFNVQILMNHAFSQAESDLTSVASSQCHIIERVNT